MELPLKAIVVIAILVLVLIVLSTFFLGSSGESLTKTEAERIFNTRCLAYSQRQCAWDVTYEPDFQQYLDACRVLYGQHREAYSCLYSLCSRCFETTDLRCSGLCNICSGHESASVDRQACCIRFSSECAGSSVDCTQVCG